MTARNLVHGRTLSVLSKFFDVTVYSYYTEESLTSSSRQKINISCKTINIYRWMLPRFKGIITKKVIKWTFYAFWINKRPLTIKKYMAYRKSHNALAHYRNIVAGYLILFLRKRFGHFDPIRSLAFLIPHKLNFKGLDVIMITSLDHPKDQQILYTCKKNGIPIVVLVHSWDNLTSHGFLSTIPDRLLVWNQFMRADAITYHNIPDNIIEVVGVPHCELYRTLAKTAQRSDLETRLQIDPHCKIITYACNVEWCVPDEKEFIDFLINQLTAGKFGSAVLIIRLHPTEPRCKEYPYLFDFEKSPVRLDSADSGFAAQHTGTVGDQTSIKHFVELMRFSDVVINYASTISLDAILFDTPVICPLFNFKLPTGAWNSARALHFDSCHYTRVVQSGAVSLPEDMDQLLSAVIESLDLPERLRAERAEIANKMMPDLPTSINIKQALQQVADSDRSSS